MVQWMLHLDEQPQPDPYKLGRCLNEILKIPKEDEIDIDTVEDRAQVVHHSKYCEPGRHWCWKQEYDPEKRQYNPSMFKEQKTANPTVSEMYTDVVSTQNMAVVKSEAEVTKVKDEHANNMSLHPG